MKNKTTLIIVIAACCVLLGSFLFKQWRERSPEDVIIPIARLQAGEIPSLPKDGLQLLLSLDFEGVADTQKEEKQKDVAGLMYARFFNFGSQGVEIYYSGDDVIVVNLPGFSNADKAYEIATHEPELYLKIEDKKHTHIKDQRTLLDRDAMEAMSIEFIGPDIPFPYLMVVHVKKEARPDFFKAMMAEENLGKELSLVGKNILLGATVLMSPSQSNIVKGTFVLFSYANEEKKYAHDSAMRINSTYFDPIPFSVEVRKGEI